MQIFNITFINNLIQQTMKKFYFFAIAALVMMAGCQKPDVDPTVVDD